MTAGRLQRHLVDVWNPAYASDAMTAHVGILLEAPQGPPPGGPFISDRVE
jgi:hypothetical protein